MNVWELHLNTDGNNHPPNYIARVDRDENKHYVPILRVINVQDNKILTEKEVMCVGPGIAPENDDIYEWEQLTRKAIEHYEQSGQYKQDNAASIV